MTAHNSHSHNALQCNTRCPFHNFLPYTQKCILKFFQSLGVVHSTTFHPELSNERFTCRISIFGMWGGFTDMTCININFFYLFDCQELCYITPKIDTTAHSSKLKTQMTAHNSHTHNALQCNTICQNAF